MALQKCHRLHADSNLTLRAQLACAIKEKITCFQYLL